SCHVRSTPGAMKRSLISLGFLLSSFWVGGSCTYQGSEPTRPCLRPIFAVAAKGRRPCRPHFPVRSLSARQGCLRRTMHFLRQFSGCCGLCQPIRYSATAGRGSSRCTRTTWQRRSHKFCDRARNRILPTNWPARASTPTRSCCEPLLVSHDCGQC